MPASNKTCKSSREADNKEYGIWKKGLWCATSGFNIEEVLKKIWYRIDLNGSQVPIYSAK